MVTMYTVYNLLSFTKMQQLFVHFITYITYALFYFKLSLSFSISLCIIILCNNSVCIRLKKYAYISIYVHFQATSTKETPPHTVTMLKLAVLTAWAKLHLACSENPYLQEVVKP